MPIGLCDFRDAELGLDHCKYKLKYKKDWAYYANMTNYEWKFTHIDAMFCVTWSIQWLEANGEHVITIAPNIVCLHRVLAFKSMLLAREASPGYTKPKSFRFKTVQPHIKCQFKRQQSVYIPSVIFQPDDIRKYLRPVVDVLERTGSEVITGHDQQEYDAVFTYYNLFDHWGGALETWQEHIPVDQSGSHLRLTFSNPY